MYGFMHKASIAAAAFVLILAAGRAEAAKKAVNGKIAFQSNRDGNAEIYVMNADGSAQTRLTNASTPNSGPSWSPDGTKIAFVANNSGIAVMNGDGTNAVIVNPSGVFQADPAWSPDGANIVFESSRDGNLEIYLMSADGSNVNRLTNNAAGDFTPSFSPDGKKIVFYSDRDGNDEIYVMNRDGSAQTRLTNNPASDAWPRFAPNGRIIFVRIVSGTSQIFVIDADGSNAQQLTFSSGGNFAPAVSPDGSQIVFYSFRDGNFEIYSMNFDGSNQTRRTNNAAVDVLPSWQPVLGIDTVGVYRPSTGQWLLRTSNTAGAPNITLTFGGQPGDLPVTGDWNGDGQTDIGIFRNGTFLLGVLKTQDFCIPCAPVTSVEAQPEFTFGQAGDRPIAGDWDGDGMDEVGVYRDGTSPSPSTFLLRVRKITFSRPCPACPLVPTTTFVTESHFFGNQGDLPVAGDWDNDGKDTIAVFHADPDGVFLLTNDFSEAEASSSFGALGDLPVAGGWNPPVPDRVGLFHPSTATFSLATSFAAPPNIVFTFGSAGDLPVTGHWTPLGN
jgi:Tol biopolymer transport system component